MNDVALHDHGNLAGFRYNPLWLHHENGSQTLQFYIHGAYQLTGTCALLGVDRWSNRNISYYALTLFHVISFRVRGVKYILLLPL